MIFLKGLKNSKNIEKKISKMSFTKMEKKSRFSNLKLILTVSTKYVFAEGNHSQTLILFLFITMHQFVRF